MANNVGNPLAQEELLRKGQAYVQLSGMEAVTVWGPDRLGWLHNLTTAPFVSLVPSTSIEGLILDSAGHVKHAFAAADDGERTWLLVDQGAGQPLADFLLSMRFMMRVEVEIVPVAVIGIMRERADLPADAVAHARIVWEDPWPRVTLGGTHYGIADADHPARASHRTLLVVAPEAIAAVTDALDAQGVTPAREISWEAARIVDRRPRPNAEVLDSGVLPHKLDWLRTAVWLNKGCFPGQETVAKVVNMGRPPRRLTFLYVEGPEGDLPVAGTKLTLDGATVGVVTSIQRDYEYGPVALALVKRTVPIQAVLEFSDGSGFVASQEAIVDPGGRSAASPQDIPGADLRKARAALGADQKPRARK